MQDAPRVLPKFPENRKKKNRASNKIHFVLGGSGGYVVDMAYDTSLLIPFADSEPILLTVKKALFSRGVEGACVKMLTLANMLSEDLRIFDLPSLGLQPN